MKYIKIILLVLCFNTTANAQLSLNNKRIADVYFLNKEYYAAAEYYKKSLQITTEQSNFLLPYDFAIQMNQEKKSTKIKDYEYAVFQLASSLRLYKNFQDAEQWYAIANSFKNPKYALSNYYYADCLKANLKYDEAISSYNFFINHYQINDGYTEMAKKAIESCKYDISEIKSPRLVKIVRLQNQINGEGSNYAPSVNNQNFMFTSSRPTINSGKIEVLVGQNSFKVSKKQTPYVNKIYTLSENPKSASVEIKKVNIDVKNMETAAVSIHPNGNMMLLTAWFDKGKTNKGIFMSKRVGDKWTDPIALGKEINLDKYNSIQPFISKDGKFLIFSSDRPGGQGKYDLWYANLGANGTATNAINLGPKINTAEDEEAPYYNSKIKKLIYSSNGSIGLGGFDFYESEGDLNNLTNPFNMGYPFNSAKDDIYFTSIKDDDSEGYISSDRSSVCCLEIFYIKNTGLTINGSLIDCVTLKPLQGVKVTISGQELNTQSMFTDASGKYNFKTNSNRGLQINAVKESYFSKKLNFNYDQLLAIDTLLSADLCLVPIIIDKPIVLKNILYEFDKAELTEESKLTLNDLYNVMIDNPNIKIELSSHTDNKGSEAYNLELSDRRAKSCVNYLIAKGVLAERMTWKGYGFSMPIAANKLANGEDNPEGRALNRRTEFKVTKK